MSNQAQCPNCGGYKVNVEKKESITETRKVPISLTKWFLQAFAGILLWGLMGTCAFLVLQSLSTGVAIIVAFLAGIPVIILIITAPFAVKQASEGRLLTSKRNTVGTNYSLYCQLCGYRWAWDNRTPYPTATIRPDLIAQGEQRLEEEQRKQQENAAALYYLTHQGKK